MMDYIFEMKDQNRYHCFFLTAFYLQDRIIGFKE